MITLKEIAKAINTKLRSILPNIEVQSKDISEGYPRPALYVDFDDVRTSPYGPISIERTISVIIYFFPTDPNHNKVEILETQQILEQAFSADFQLREGFVIFPAELSSTKVDGVLQVSFDLYYIERIDEDNNDPSELMDTLDLTLEGEQ